MTTNAKLIALVAALAITGTGLTATTAAARGERGAGMTPPSFSELDVDGNGVINQADLTAFAAARFAAVDTDGSGTLSAAELKAHAEAEASERADRMGTRMMNRMDANGDGELSQEEMQARGQGGRGGDMGARMLDRADTDGDGAVSEAEYTAALATMQEHGGKGRMGKGEHGRHGDDERRPRN